MQKLSESKKNLSHKTYHLPSAESVKQTDAEEKDFMARSSHANNSGAERFIIRILSSAILMTLESRRNAIAQF